MADAAVREAAAGSHRVISLRTYGIIAAGLAFLGLFAAYRIQSGTLKERTAERDTALSSVTALETASKGKDDTISALEAAVASWKALSTPAPDTKAAAARLAAAEAQLNARSRALSAREEAERATPTCAKVLAIDLVASCPAAAAGVRERARSGVPRPASGSPGPRGEAPP